MMLKNFLIQQRDSFIEEKSSVTEAMEKLQKHVNYNKDYLEDLQFMIDLLEREINYLEESESN